MPMVQIGHFSPDAPSVDIMVDGEMAFQNVGFRESTELAELDAGSHHVEIRAHGADDAVLEQELMLEDNMHYTVIASGLLEEDDLTIEIIEH